MWFFQPDPDPDRLAQYPADPIPDLENRIRISGNGKPEL